MKKTLIKLKKKMKKKNQQLKLKFIILDKFLNNYLIKNIHKNSKFKQIKLLYPKTLKVNFILKAIKKIKINLKKL